VATVDDVEATVDDVEAVLDFDVIVATPLLAAFNDGVIAAKKLTQRDVSKATFDSIFPLLFKFRKPG
jgi:hypothetical protein